MNLFAPFGRFVVRFGALLTKALKSAIVRGLTDAVVREALARVRRAADLFVTDAERREWAVRTLMAELHLRESVARLAVELAVQVYKQERGHA